MLSAIVGKDFFLSCYNPLGEIMDMMALINSAINFLLYCLMSTQFRTAGKKILGIKGRNAATALRRISSKVEVSYTIVGNNQRK